MRCFDRVVGKLAPSESLLPVIPVPDTLACGMQNRVRLEIVDGPLTGKKFEFAEHDTFIFGRASDCHAHLSDDTLVSRHHFILEVKSASRTAARLRQPKRYACEQPQMRRQKGRRVSRAMGAKGSDLTGVLLKRHFYKVPKRRSHRMIASLHHLKQAPILTAVPARPDKR